MIAPITFPRVSGTTATYMHPLLQASVLQSARPADLVDPSARTGPAQPPAVSAVGPVDRTAAYTASLARDATTVVNSAKATARTTGTPAADPAAELARQIVLERASTQVGVLLERAAGERRVALSSGVPATRLAELNTTTSHLYHALDVLA